MVTFRRLRFADLPLLWWWRNYRVRPQAFGKYPTSWRWLLNWYFGEQKTHPVSCIILLDGKRVGYIHASREWVLGIYLGRARGRGVGKKAVEWVIGIGRICKKEITCGTDIPEFFEKCGFRRLEWVMDKGVMRCRMVVP